MSALQREDDLIREPPLDLDPHQLSLVVVVNQRSVRRLPRFLTDVAKDDALGSVTLTIIYPSELAVRILHYVDGYRHVRTVEADSESKPDTAQALTEDMPYQIHRYVTALELRDLPRARSAYAAANQVHRHLVELGLGHHIPLLLRTKHTPRHLVAGYLDFARTARDSDAPHLQSYLGSLALPASTPRLESVDPRGSGVEIRIWLTSVLACVEDQPPWRFRVLLVDSAGKTVKSEPAVLSSRVDKLGRRQWEEVVARVPVAQASSGDHRLAIEYHTDVDGWDHRQWVSPRKGALLSARTVTMRPTPPGALPVRYLVHTTGAAKLTYVTVQQGDRVRDRLGWKVRLLRKDVSLITGDTQPKSLRALALLRLLTLPFFAGRQIWLVGERYDTAQDNGLHLFRYLRTHKKRSPVYYVIDRDSPQRDRVQDMGHVIAHSSWRHRLLMLHASVLANAYSMHYLIPRQWKPVSYEHHLAWRIGALRLYLKHGVHLSPEAVDRGASGYDVVLTVTPRETEALRTGSGYQEQLTETGLPRYDALVPTPSARTILFMSTWRRYLVPQVFGGSNQDQIPFESSDYEQFMRGFLGSARLQEMLAAHDYSLVMLPHYQLAHHFTSMPTAGDQIGLADTDEISFQDQIRGCDAFITDYSSVHFDIAYLGTPIIYARFDEQDFATRHAAPGWFDYERDGFGPVTHTITETLDALERLLQRGCAPDPFYAARIAATFAHQDHNNSRRVVDAVQERLGAQR